MKAKMQGVHRGYYGNFFFSIDVKLNGKKFVLSADQSSFVPHIKRDIQETELEKIGFSVCEKLNEEHTQRERAERAELALLKIGMATNERKTYEAVAAFFNVKVGQLWTLAKKLGAAK